MRSELAKHGLGAFLRERKLQDPDGRSLHQYGTTDVELADMQFYLQSHDGLHWRARDCGALFLVLADWAFRHARTAHGYLQDVARPLGLRVLPEQLVQRLNEGLVYWKRRTIQPERYEWNSIVLLEGGLPRHMSRANVAALTAAITSDLSWFVLSDPRSVDTFTKFLDGKRDVYPELLGTLDDRLFWHRFFLQFAEYYKKMAGHLLLPKRGEDAADWLKRIPVPAAPSNHLALRTDDDPLFLNVLFPCLTAFPPTAWLRVNAAESRVSEARVEPRSPRTPPQGSRIAARPPELGLLTELRERRPLGQPLYTYRVTAAEFTTLRDEVRRDVNAGRTDTFAAARFCMYASEQLCRSYVGGPWTWDLVLEPIRWDPTPNVRSAVVNTGLEFWRRRVHVTTYMQRPLMTLVCEGGLPVNMLTDGRDTYFRQFFRALIQNAERFQAPASRFVEEQISLLPAAFRDRTVMELSSALADAVVALRAKIPPQTPDPVEFLQQKDPNWHANIPLRLDDGTFREFLRGLLVQPTERAQIETPIEISTVLYRSTPARIERRATCADVASVDSLAQVLGIDRDALRTHTRIVLSLVTVTGERHQVAVARLSADQSRYNLERLPVSPVRHEAGVTANILLAATVGERELACGDIPGGGPLLENVPWVFEGGERPVARLLAQGGLRSSQSELIVLPPRNARPASSADTKILGRELISVRTTSTWSTDDESWTVMTATQARPVTRYVFAGRLSRSGFSGSEYWAGLPRLDAIDESNQRATVPTSKMEIRLRGTPAWQRWGSLIGDLEVRVREGNETAFRGEITTLPADTKISLNIRDVTITMRATGLEEARLGTGGVVKATGGEACMRLTGDSNDATIQLHVVFRSGRCTVSVPSPLRVTQFVGREGPTKGPVVLDRIGQIRALAISPDARERFTLEARVQGPIGWIPLAQVPRADPTATVWELPLDVLRPQLEDLFAASGNLEAQIDLRLSSPRSSYHPTLRISRYEAEPSPLWISEEKLVVQIDAGAAERIGAMGLELLQLQLRPLADPDQSPRDIARVAGSNQSWALSAADLATAPTWLITGSIRNRVRLRPLLVPSRTFDESQPPKDELDRLMRVRENSARLDQLDVLATDLSTHWERTEWEELPRFLETFGTLPSPTFDVLRAIARDSTAAAGALLRCSANVDVLRQIWNGMEGLPFLWAFVPMSSWQTVARQLGRWTTECACGNAEQAARLVRLYTDPFRDAAEHLTIFLDVLHHLFGRTIRSVGTPRTPYLDLSQEVLRVQLRTHAQEMLARHAEEWWPTNFGPVRTTDDIELGDDTAVHALDGLGIAHHQPFLKIPYLVGVAAGMDRHISRDSILTARRVRTFDPAWFDVSHAIGFSIAAGARIRSQGNHE